MQCKASMFSTPESRILRRSHRGLLSDLRYWPLPRHLLASLLAPGRLQRCTAIERKRSRRKEVLREQTAILETLELETHPFHEFKKRLIEPDEQNDPVIKAEIDILRDQMFHFEFLIPKRFCEHSPSRDEQYRRRLEHVWTTKIILLGYEQTCRHLRGRRGLRMIQGELERYFTSAEYLLFTEAECKEFRRYLFLMTETLRLGWNDHKMTQWTCQRSAKDEGPGCYCPYGADVIQHLGLEAIDLDITVPNGS